MTNIPINMSTCLDLENPQSALMSAFMDKKIDIFRKALNTMHADPNLVDPKIDMTIFEKVLMTPKSTEFIKACIEYEANLYAKNNINRYPIHYAIDSCCPENLECFLAPYDKSKINVKYSNANCLNLLMKMLDKNKDHSDDIIECVKIMLKNGCDPNMPNEKSETPFFSLLKIQQKLKSPQKLKDLVKYFIQHGDIDFYTYRGEKMREMFKNLNPGLAIPEKKEISVDIDYLVQLLRASNKEEEFKNKFKIFKTSASNDEWNNPILLYTAVQNHVEEIVEFLVSEGIDVNKTVESQSPPTFLAASSGYFKLLKILLTKFDQKITFKSKTLLHEICRHFGVDSGENVDYQKCFDIVVKDKNCDKIDVNQKDDQNCIALHYAVRYHNDEAQKQLLKRQSFVGTRNKFNESPLDDMKKSVLEEHLDYCVTSNTRQSDKEEHKIHVSYAFLRSPDAKAGKSQMVSEMAPLKSIADNKELRPLILHPVLLSFVYLKWNKLRNFFLCNFALFFVLMISLVAYIVMEQQAIRNGDEESYQGISSTLFWIAMAGILILTIREGFQFYFSGLSYFCSFINILELVLISFSITVLCVLDSKDVSTCNQLFRVATIILVSYEMMQLISAVSVFDVSKHMVILKTVAMTFLKSIFIFSIPLITFSLCFFILFGAGVKNTSDSQLKDDPKTDNNSTICCKKDDDEEDEFNSFGSVGIAFVKTFVMMTGEFDASSLKLEKGPFFSIIFVLYVFFGFMVIFNLLNAFAVEDTHVIKSEGELVDVQQKIEELYKYEKMPRKIRQNLYLGKLNSRLLLLVETIPEARIIIPLNRKNQCLAMQQRKPDMHEVKIDIQNDEATVALNGGDDRNHKDVVKILPMDKKIIKEFRHLLDRKIHSEFDKKKEESLKQKLDEMDRKLNELTELLKQKLSP